MATALLNPILPRPIDWCREQKLPSVRIVEFFVLLPFDLFQERSRLPITAREISTQQWALLARNKNFIAYLLTQNTRRSVYCNCRSDLLYRNHNPIANSLVQECAMSRVLLVSWYLRFRGYKGTRKIQRKYPVIFQTRLTQKGGRRQGPLVTTSSKMAFSV